MTYLNLGRRKYIDKVLNGKAGPLRTKVVKGGADRNKKEKKPYYADRK